MIVPQDLLEAAKPTSSVAPIPTVVPGTDPVYYKSGDVGNRTLW